MTLYKQNDLIKEEDNLWRLEFGNSFENCKVLVTGATGFIGSHLCQALIALEADVYGLSRTAHSQNLVPGCQAKQVDLCDLNATQKILSDIEPQFIYHLAGFVNTQREINLVLPMLQNNLVSTVNLLVSATTIGCERIIVAGTSEELDAGISAGEIPTSPYAASKQAAKAYAKMFNLLYKTPVVVARPFLTYGPRQVSAKLIPYVITTMLRDKNPKINSGRRICDFIYVLDVIRGFLRVGIQPDIIGRVIDLGTGKGIQIRKVVELINELIGNSCRPEFGSISARIGEQAQVANKHKTQQLLAWQPRWELQDGLIETIKWYRTLITNVTDK